MFGVVGCSRLLSKVGVLTLAFALRSRIVIGVALRNSAPVAVRVAASLLSRRGIPLAVRTLASQRMNKWRWLHT